MTSRPLTTALLALLLGACATTAPRPAVITAPAPSPASAHSAPAVLTVAERYVSEANVRDELDSLATWATPDGRTWLIASAKSSHQLVVFDGDSGQRLRTFGNPGSQPGQFNRPNGVAVYGDHLFVVERDNHRVQVLSLPAFTPVGTFGATELRSPYGIWLTETEPGELTAYITDSFMYGKQFDQVPALDELDQRVRRYRVQFDQHDRLRTSYAGAFGDTGAAGALRMVESIAGDPANDRLLVADESTGATPGASSARPAATAATASSATDAARSGSTLREYTLAGRYTGRSLPADSFAAEAEGVALWSCPDGGGYWIAVDQLAPLTIFHLFDRITLAPRGSFSGAVTAHTDGVALHAAATPSFPGGALYAVHDDQAISAFDLRDVARALQLQPGCVQ